jgi:hypothetical protein
MILSKMSVAAAKKALKQVAKPKPVSPEKLEARARGLAAFEERKAFKKAIRAAKATGSSAYTKQPRRPVEQREKTHMLE